MSEEKTYTDSAMSDMVRNYILTRKDQIKIIQHLGTTCKGKFPFNPMEATEEILDIFISDPENFKHAVMNAVCRLVAEWHDDERAKAVLNHVDVVITESTKIKLNEWNSTYEGVPVGVECQVVMVFPEETYTKSATARCSGCQREEQVKRLTNLPICGNKDCSYYKKEMVVDEGTIVTGDIRNVMIQEPIEEAKSSSPALKMCVLKDEAVAETLMGEKKKVIGIFKSHPQKGKATNKPLIHAVSVEPLADKKALMPNDAQKKFFRELSTKPDYFETLSESWAPEIRFEDLAKICVIIALVGGIKIDTLRGIIHAFLVGDPGTGKTKILEFLLEVIQKSAMAVGGTMSGSGVTVTMDTLPNRMKIPRAGIVPLCHGSAVALDELNQLEDEDIGKLYGAMESGIIHYNKGGFDETFKAETTIIAGANPKGYEYDSSSGMLPNIGLPLPILTRFDLITNMIGTKPPSERAAIRKHILYIRKHGIEKYIKEKNLLKAEELTLLINYAKTFNPELSDEATKILNDFQEVMEELQANNEQVAGAKRADNRSLESLIRISTAIARLHFLDEVTAECAILAVEIYKKTLQTFGVKTDKGATQLNWHDVAKDKNSAAEFTWKKIESETNSKLIDAVIFYKRLMKDYSKLYRNTDDVDKWFKKNQENGNIIMQSGLYKWVG